jgi:hypothetical protein
MLRVAARNVEIRLLWFRRTDDTIVTCPKCDYKARRKDVFGDDDEA